LRNIDNTDLEISIQQEKLEKYKIEMQIVRQSFIKVTGDFFATWYDSTARHYITSGSQNTIRLGKDQLAKLKAKLKDLIDNAAKYADDCLSADSLWCKLPPKTEDNYVSAYSQHGTNCPEIINKPIRKGLGKLGVLLEEYGYNVATKPGTYDDNVSIWNNKNISPYPTNPMPYYPDSLDWSPKMKTLMKRYDELCKQAQDAYSNINRIQQSKIDKQASDLWDSV
jgi:hypothetical protein